MGLSLRYSLSGSRFEVPRQVRCTYNAKMVCIHIYIYAGYRLSTPNLSWWNSSPVWASRLRLSRLNQGQSQVPGLTGGYHI